MLAHAQDQPIPFSTWLDIRDLVNASDSSRSRPIWLAAVESEYVQAREDVGAHTIFRLRLRRMPTLHREIELRLLFADSGAPIQVSAWSETGSLAFTGVTTPYQTGLVSSESFLIPIEECDYIELQVPGNGGALEGVYLASLKSVAVSESLDLGATDHMVLDAFGKVPARVLTEDRKLFGRYHAELEPGVLMLNLDHRPGELIEFQLVNQPSLSVIHFEALGAQPGLPLHIYVNGVYYGVASMTFPDLADPAYSALERSFEKDLRFSYSGWLRGQAIIPGSGLRSGLNQLEFRLSNHSDPVALRSVAIELKQVDRP